MSDHYDRLETRTLCARESALFRDLRHLLTVSKPRAAALRAQLKGVEIASLSSREKLVAIPVIRRATMIAMQDERTPFGGFSAARIGSLKKVYIGPGALTSAEGYAKDWWGVGRALFAAGLRKGSIVVNCFAYDLNPQGHMIEAGAAAIGCPVIPAGAAPLDDKIAAIQRLRPTFFCGAADHLKEILDHAADRGVDATSIENALVTGPMTAGLRSEFALRGITVCCAFMLPELGLIAFESETTGGLCVSEGLILELVVPGTGVPVRSGTEGEIVVSRINADYPLLRYGTGALASELPRTATCGRTNMRISMPRDLAPESAICAGTRIHVTQLIEIARQHPDVGRMRLVIGRLREQDALRLKVEHGGDAAIVGERLSETLHRVTRVRGTVELVEPGSLSDEDAMIIDERPLN